MSDLSKENFGDLTVVVPVFNEESGVVPALRELRGAFPEIKILPSMMDQRIKARKF